MRVKRNIGTVFATGFFAVLSCLIFFPIFAGIIASFRPGIELIRRGLSVNLDVTTMNLNNYNYLFSGNADSKKYWMWFKNSMVLTLVTVVLTLLLWQSCRSFSYSSASRSTS